MKNLISVIMPMYNAEEFVFESVQSVLSQSYDFFELIIINDASTDTSLDIVSSIRDERIRLINNLTNLGPDRTVNKGMTSAIGSFICHVDADDIIPPDSLRLRIELAEQRKVPIVHGGLTSFYPNGETLYYPPLDANNLQLFASFLSGKRQHFGINMNAMLYTSTCVAEIGMREETTLGFNADYEYALRLLTRYPSIPLDMNLYFYRYVEDGNLQNSKKKEGWEEHLKKVEEHYLHLIQK